MSTHHCNRCQKFFQSALLLCPDCDKDEIAALRKKEAINGIRCGDFEEVWPAKRNDKRRICSICLKNIPPGVDYYKQFEYPYEARQIRWIACKECFNSHKRGD